MTHKLMTLTPTTSRSGQTSGFSLALVLSASLLVSQPAFAACGGAGGGGETPSASSTPNSGARIDPAKRYAEGVTLLQEKKFKQAERAFADVLDVAGRDPNANYLMAMAKLGRDDQKGARKYLRSAVKYDADHAQARGWLGFVEARLGDTKKADAQKTALLAMKTACGSGCAEAQQIDAAIAQIDQAMTQPSESLAPAANLPGLVTPAQGDAQYLTASGLINEGRYGEALASLRVAGQAFGPHPDVLTYLGFANRKLGQHDKAIGFYTAALKLEPAHRGATEYLGEYYVETGDLKRARAQLARLEAICAYGCEEAEELRRWIVAADR